MYMTVVVDEQRRGAGRLRYRDPEVETTWVAVFYDI